MQYKVLHVIPQFSIGGREKVVFTLMEGLDRNYFLPSILSLKKSQFIPEYFSRGNFSISCLNKQDHGFDLALIFELKKFLLEEGIDIVHTHNPGSFLYGGLAAKLAKVAVIINTEHGYSYAISKKKQFAEDILRNHINKTIAVSQSLKHYLCSMTRTKPEKISVIHNGIKTQHFLANHINSGLKDEMKLANNKTIGVVGRLDPVKGHKILIKAFSLCLQQNQNIRLIVTGDGPLKSQLERLAESLHIRNEVVFLGNRSDIPQILALIDIFVLPSLSEGLSITLLEAMAAGKAIIATNVGGNSEIIDDGLTGFLIPPKTPSQLAQRILELIENPAQAQQMGDHARVKAIKHFNNDIFINKIKELYMNCLNNEG